MRHCCCRFRSQIWECLVVQDLVWRIRDQGIASENVPLESPSKILASGLNTVTLHSPSRDQAQALLDNKIMMLRIEKKRGTVKDQVTSELQLVIDPSHAAKCAQKHLRHPDPNVGKLQARKEAEAAAICAAHGPDHPGAVPAPPRNAHYDDPLESQRLWIQESLLRMAVPEMVREWEEREQAKIEAKLNKGKKAVSKTGDSKKTGESLKPDTPVKPRRKPVKPKIPLPSESESEEDLFVSSQRSSENVFRAPSATTASTASGSAKTDDPSQSSRASSQSSSEGTKRTKNANSVSLSSDSDIEVLSPGRFPKAKVRQSPRKSPRTSRTQTSIRDASRSNAEDDNLPAPPRLDFKAVKQSRRTSSIKARHAASDGNVNKMKDKIREKPQYTYHDLCSESSSSSDEDLPSLTSLLGNDGKARESSKATQNMPAGKLTTAKAVTVASSSQTKSDKAPKQSGSHPPPSQIIDLCSSD